MAKKEIEKRQSTQVGKAGDFSAHAGSGLENVGAADLLVPRLAIMQSLSPQMKPKTADYIEGANLGDICDVGARELFKDGILFVPIFYRKDYLEWAPRKSGEGLKKIHSSPSILDECTRNDRNQPVLPNGNYIAETAQFFGLNLSADGRKSFIPMASTQLKKARGWLTMATGEKLEREDGSVFTPPLFYRCYKLTTGEESNSEGTWAGWKIERGPSLPELGGKPWSMNWESIKQESVEFLASLKSGEANVDASQLDDRPSSEAAM